MGKGIEARVLGPLEILVEGERVDVRGGKQRELLAILLVHASEVVSSDRLIEGLWRDAPPPSALKTLQALVSRLRSDLGSASEALETQGYGYRLRVEPERLDADAFRAGVEEGRRTLARGDAEAAAERLRAALALWRGPAFAEFQYEDFAQAEIARLDELRLAAQEERIAADLELGRHQELVGELETLVAEHPLRERLRGQLMLALYRAGRQAEALATYDDGRRALAEELGLEPSQALQQLQRKILEHDPSLAAPEPARRLRIAPRSRVPLVAAALGAVVLAVAAGAALQRGLGDDAEVETAGALALDPESGDVVERVPLGTAPSALAVGEGSVWVLDADDRTVSQIDAETRRLVRTFSTSATPTDVAVGARSVWIGNAPSAGNFLPTSITQLDPETGLVVDTIDLGAPRGGHLYSVLAGFSRQHIAAAEDALWVINPDLTVWRIDPRSNRIVARIEDVRAENIAVGEGKVWITEGTVLAEIDPSVNAIARRVRLGEGVSLAGIAIGGGAVWVADPQAGKLWRVETGPNGAKRSIPLETWVAGVSFGEGAVWVTNEIADAVYRIDPRTGSSRRVGGATAPRAVDAGEGGVWLTAASPPSEDAALPASVCRDVYSRVESPDVLIVSSLPLQGDARQWTQPMVDAIRRVLERRGFEAGTFSVGYQSCDSSTAQAGGEDFFRCGFVAKAFSRNLRVVGVFGSFASPCSYPQIPIANEAPDGPLAMLSPSNTLDDLTQDDELYPTGTRNYFRLATPDRYQGFAQAELARQLGHDRLFLLTSRDEEYGRQYPEGLRAYARRVGVRIVGEASFDPEAEASEQLVRKVVRSEPQSVAIVGLLTPETGAMIRELRSALGPDVALSAPDAFYLPDDLRKLAGDAAQGMYVTNYGIPNDKLPPAGKEFLKSFASEHGGDPGPDFAASYGAQAAEIFLEAIARSDGTRASVREEIRRTQVRNGILGDVAFDPNGDLVEGPMTILRFSGRDFVVDRVVRVRASAPSP